MSPSHTQRQRNVSAETASFLLADQRLQYSLQQTDFSLVPALALRMPALLSAEHPRRLLQYNLPLDYNPHPYSRHLS